MLPRLASELFLTIDNTLASTPLFSLPKRGEFMDEFRADMGDDGAVDMRLPQMVLACEGSSSRSRKRTSEEISFR